MTAGRSFSGPRFVEPRRARNVRPDARRISASPAGRVSATQPNASSPPFSRTARSTSIASGSITTQRHAASTTGGSPNFSVKSSGLPSSTMRSAGRISAAKAPSVASLTPRGLSMMQVGTCVAASMRASRSRPDAVGELRPRDQQRPLRRSDDAEHRIRRGIAEFHRCGGERGSAPATPRRCRATRRIEQIGRQAEMHRARAAGAGDPERLRDVDAQRLGGRRGPRRLGNRRRHLGLAQLLKAAAPDLARLGVAREQDQRRFLARAPSSARRRRWRGPARPSPSRCRARRSAGPRRRPCARRRPPGAHARDRARYRTPRRRST